MTLGVVAVRRDAAGPARPPGAPALHLHQRPRRDRAAPAAAGARASARRINGARIWIHVGPFSFQPGEVAKVLLVITFAGYLVLHRDALALAGRRVAFVDLPRGRDLGPILAMWLVSLGILVFQHDLGSSAAVLRPVPDDALRRHRAARLARGRRRRCSSPAPTSTYAVHRPRAGALPALVGRVGPLRRRHRRQGPARSVEAHVRHGLGRPARPRPRPGPPWRIPVRRDRLHLRRRSARSSG